MEAIGLALPAMRLLAVLCRVTGLVLFAPVLSSTAIPVMVRVFLVLSLSMIITLATPATNLPVENIIDLGLLAGSELLVGVLLGGFAQMVFQALQLVGQLIGAQMGTELAGIINPTFHEQVSNLALFFSMIASLAFLSVGGHRELLDSLLVAFRELPVGSAITADRLDELVLQLFGHSMIFAIRVAAPIVLALVLIELALGLIGRSVVQINLMSVGASLRIGVGIGMLLLTIHLLTPLLFDALREASDASQLALASLTER